jgi:hypothetical protein
MGIPEQVPDVSQYPKPPQDQIWSNEPLLRRTQPVLTPVPRSEWPAPAKPPEMPGPAVSEKRAPSLLQQAPVRSTDQPAISRNQEPPAQGVQAPLSSRDQPGAAVQEKQAAVPPPSEDPYGNLPYGVPVKGKKGFVTLEAHANLPEIDVRGIAPGTPVEFPDPRDPSQIIQFRVPK